MDFNKKKIPQSNSKNRIILWHSVFITWLEWISNIVTEMKRQYYKYIDQYD